MKRLLALMVWFGLYVHTFATTIVYGIITHFILVYNERRYPRVASVGSEITVDTQIYAMMIKAY